MGGTVVPFVAAGLSQRDSTPPAFVRGDGDGFALDLEFTEPLRNQAYTLGSWSWRRGNVLFECFQIIVSNNRLFMQGVDTEADPGVDQITYNPIIPDVCDLAGNLLDPFVALLNFP